ncbi:unnamed protein product [Phytophthora lilii]|uniref:Unnamed protein product n=1 Tax=Phytophthora lilii TaxID=2077276 RepID=A0A9W6TQE5_9STRA|nr:unnamed protein product [Phytophthora lilii]
MKLLWVLDHSYQQWKLVCLPFVAADSPKQFKEVLQNRLLMMKVVKQYMNSVVCYLQDFHVPYEDNSFGIDLVLLSLILWNLESDSELLPPPGAVIERSSPTAVLSSYTTLIVS